MAQKKKIMVFVPAASGHVNPICGLIHELCKNKNIEVLFYSDEIYRDVIEKAGAKFRLNEAPTFSKVDPKIFASKMQFSNLLDITIDFAFDQLPQYIAEVEKEKPDLILYDGLSFSAKYLIEMIKVRHANGDKSIPIPKTALFSPNFPFSEKMIKFLNDRNENIWTTLALLNTFRKQFVLSWYYGISVYNPIRVFKEMSRNINLVGINPELQPDRNDFDDTFKFVGTCTSEESRSVDLKQDPELNAFLTQFDKKPNDLKLILFSMGTLFHTKFYVIEKAVEAFIKYDENRNRRFRLRDFKIIVSVGAPGLKKFNEKISNGELNIPNNILLRASVPQLEVLKRADLFITHCGMNSTLETIKYGVPVVALPSNVDQPIKAFRIFDELKFGVCLDPDSFTIDKLNDSIDQVLSDGMFKADIERMSKISAKYNGAIEGAKILTDYLYK